MEFSQSQIHETYSSQTSQREGGGAGGCIPVSSIQIRPLDRSEYPLVSHLLDPGAPPIDHDYSRIIAAFDNTSGEVVGIIALQMTLHAEPLIVDPRYQGKGVWKPLAEWVDGYLTMMGAQAIYCQPTNPKAQVIAERMGFVEAEFPLYMKRYDQQEQETIPEEE